LEDDLNEQNIKRAAGARDMKERSVLKIIASHFSVNDIPRVLWFWIDRKTYFHPSICHYWKRLLFSWIITLLLRALLTYFGWN